MLETTLIDRFYKSCEITDYNDAIAIQDNNEKISYGSLKLSIDNVAAYFNEIGVKSGDRVVLVINNSIEYVIAFYAIWKIGGIVVALNSQSKVHEIQNVVSQCEAMCLLVDDFKKEMILSLKNLNVKLMSLATEKVDGVYRWCDAINYTAYVENAVLDGASPAQIIFTSGTTGNPKGVLLSHGNLMSNTADIVDYLQLTEKDSVLNVLPFHYSYGNSVLHSHIYSGAKIILAGSMAFPQQTVNSLREFNVTGFYGVPSTYSLLLARSDWAEKKLPLRYLTQAGGPMNKPLTQQLLSSIDSDVQLFVMYGQTEATARISWLPPQFLHNKTGSVGVALKHVKIEIRNSQGEVLESNNKGDVFVTGDSIMQGYWNNEKATQQVLNHGWLKTGDIGYLDEDGFLYLEGRKNDMIKVGAHRINPLELEEVINKLSFVDDSAVVGVDDDILGQELCAYIVGEKSKKNILLIKKHCNEYLPSHKIPRKIEWIGALPKTSSGKIKRYKLMQMQEEDNVKQYS